MRRAALWWARRHVKIFPCMPGTKKPYVKWKDGATDDLAVIRDWWEKWPLANIAAPTGKDNGWVVVDVDNRAALGALVPPETKGVITPRGGLHLYYDHPGIDIHNDQAPPGKPTRLSAMGGVDVRGDGGFVLLPPSADEDGVPYRMGERWKQLSGFTPMPAAWVAKLLSGRTNGTDGDFGEISIEVGGRHESLFNTGMTLWHAGLEPDAIKEALHAINRQFPQPKTGVQQEVDGIVKWVAEQPRGEAAYQAEARRQYMRLRGMEVAKQRIVDEQPVDPRMVWRGHELVAQDHAFTWLVQGLVVAGSETVTGGVKKTLKSYVDTIVNVGLAAGVPILGRFAVPEPRPVKVYVGEGGTGPYARRLERVAAAMGVDLKQVPLEVQFETAPVNSRTFRQWLEEDLARGYARISIDPLYAFHADVNAANLYERGRMLRQLSEPCTAAGVSVNIVDHFNKTGTGRGLERLTMTGMAEWADGWLLITHREKPDVEAGEFKLLLEVGGRQWGGKEWDLDLCVGAFDEDAGEHTGAVTWAVRKHMGDDAEGHSDGWQRVERDIRDLTEEHPFEFTKDQIRTKVGGNREVFSKVWDSLETQGWVQERAVAQPEGGRVVRRQRWGVGYGWDQPRP
jgi:hypothetical protein